MIDPGRYRQRAVLLCAWLAVLAGLAGPASGASAAKGALARILERFPEADVNKDGTLTVAEFKAWGAKKFPQADADGDGELTGAELRALGAKLLRQGAAAGKKAVRNSPPGRLAALMAAAKAAVAMTGDSWRGLPKEVLSAQGTSQRDFVPVVLTGKQVPTLKGTPAGKLVAFRFADGWQPIPVQMDERRVAEFYDIYNRFRGAQRGRGVYTLRGPSFKTLVYADPNTFTGADPVAGLDADDEIAFMAKDAGRQAKDVPEPKGVVAGSGVEVALTDPLTRATSYVYLFRSSGGLDPSAGKDYVQYNFRLRAGPDKYKETWLVGGKPGLSLRPKDTSGYKNPEDTWVRTKYYRRHFQAKTISDVLAIPAPHGSDADLLDMHKALFAPGVPGRSVLTFTQGEGAFVANLDGPVRAIRSAIGANSGPLTQFESIFYERLEVSKTYLRVHTIAGVVNFFDYSPAAAGMTYRNSRNPAGVPVDGRPDEMKTGPVVWETLSGKQGSLVQLHRLVTTAKVRVTTYYNDDRDTPIPQINGDSHAYASSGPWIVGHIPNTDPRRGASDRLTGTRYIYYAPSDPTPALANRLLAEAAQPLIIRTRAMK